MSFANPTMLRVGMTGRLGGLGQTVTSRVVLSTVIKGDTYFWNEYYLSDENGTASVLVFEEDEAGYVWRWFKDYVPLRAPTAAWASTRRVDERIDLTGEALPVTLISQSLVRFIEGRAPEGVELNDLASYFNAEKSGRMLVVSWTGEEVECYLGEVLPAGRVANAFGLKSLRVRRPELTGFVAAGREDETGRSDFWNWMVVMGALAVVGAVIAAVVFQDYRSVRGAPPTRQAANERRLVLDATGRIATGGVEAGVSLRVKARTVVEVGRLGRNFDRNEYLLVTAAGKSGLLVEAPLGEPEDWCVFEGVPPGAGLTPLRLGALRAGQSIARDGKVYGVRELQLCRARAVEGANTPETWSGEVQYGLIANEGEDWLLLRWNERVVWCYRGKKIAAKTVFSEWLKR